MAGYCAHENLNEKSKKTYPYLLDVQSPLLNDLETRLVIPLVRKEQFWKSMIKNLNPTILINEEEYLLLTQQMAAIPLTQVGALTCDCSAKRHEILSAIDFLITGI